jgi:phosphoribosylformimino-5-aminoimidazole carboxamide ribotide isomerase
VELYPAIDLHAGRVVRASRATLSRATIYHRDPLAVADGFVAAGARWIHLVDLDRAFGVGDQTPLVGALVKRVPIPVQIGGGLASLEAVETMRDLGAQRVLLGARVAAAPGLLEALTDQFSPDSLGLALDVREGRVWARQWAEASRFTPTVLARRARAAGITTVAVTELSREGALAGADWERAAHLAREAAVAVIVSGGVNGLSDLRRIREAGLAGAIVGRALFERRFTLEDALACCSSSSPD